MKSANPPYTRIGLEPPLRQILLFEIIFPTVLLVLGIFTGLLQVLYRAGIIRSTDSRPRVGAKVLHRHRSIFVSSNRLGYNSRRATNLRPLAEIFLRRFLRLDRHLP